MSNMRSLNPVLRTPRPNENKKPELNTDETNTSKARGGHQEDCRERNERMKMLGY